MTAPVRGNIRVLREACMCQEDHGEEDESAPCTNHATHELCIASDSMGSDWMPLCESCLEAHKKVVEENGGLTGTCDTCKAEDVIIVPVRDSEEGLHGPVYDLCPTCLEKHKAYEHQMWADTFPNQAAMEEEDLHDDMRTDVSEEEWSMMQDDDEDEAAFQRQLDKDQREEEVYMAQQEAELRAIPETPASPIFLSSVGNCLTHAFDNVAEIARDDSHFNLTGPTPVLNSPDYVGFAAYWEGQKTIIICVNIATSLAYWTLADGDVRFVRFGALANVINRIRSWGYPIARAQLINQ